MTRQPLLIVAVLTAATMTASVATAAPREGEGAQGAESGAAAVNPDTNPTRLFFTPTGRTLSKGEGSVGLTAAIIPFVHVGITDRVSFGFSALPVGERPSEIPMLLMPKVQVYRGASTQAAVGVLHGVSIGNGSLGLAYGVVTHGDADNAVTVGTGWVYLHTGHDVGRAPVGIFGAERRMSPKTKFIADGYAFQHGGMASVGVRYTGKRVAADVGVIMPLTTEAFFAGPVVNFAWRLGGR